MKYIFTCFCLLSGLISQAQTAIVAHKSHSGTAIDFFIDPDTNFGLPSRKLVQVVYLNDSTSLHVYSRFGEDFEYDTVHNRLSYFLNIDSVKQQDPYFKRVEYVNFNHSADSSRIKKSRFEIRQTPEIEEYNQSQPQQQTPKKKKNSYLLFLFGITGGGILLIKLFSRSKIANPSIT